MRNIEVDIPFEILIADQSSLQNQLNTGITHITQVNEITGVTNRRRCIQRKQHITGFPIEIIQATAQASAEKIKFCTYIPVCIGFPSNITGTFLTPLVSSLIIIIYHFVRIGIQIITDIVVTLRTDRSLQLQKMCIRDRPSAVPYIRISIRNTKPGCSSTARQCRANRFLIPYGSLTLLRACSIY